VGSPGREPPRSIPPELREQQRLSRSGAPSIDRGHFAKTKLALHFGAGAHRAASGIWAHPHARWLNQRGPGHEIAVGAPTHRSRVTRRLFCPRLRLRPRFLAGEEGSTPWTRPPFTPRSPRGEPGLLTGGRASMRPTVIAYRLLQPVKERRTSTLTSYVPRSTTRTATLFVFCALW